MQGYLTLLNALRQFSRSNSKLDSSNEFYSPLFSAVGTCRMAYRTISKMYYNALLEGW